MVEQTDVEIRGRESDIYLRILTSARANTVPPGHSQLFSVAQELCKSICNAEAQKIHPIFTDDMLVEEFVEIQTERVRRILTAIPSAFHHWACKTHDGREIEPFLMTVSNMTTASKEIADMTPEDVLTAYGTVWMHVRALSEVLPDGNSKLKRARCLHASRDGIECVADLYLGSEDFNSPLLEWAIVDALVLDRITDFASACAYTGNLPKTANDQVLEGPLLPTGGAYPIGVKLNSPIATILVGLIEPVLKLAFELVTLCLSWWVCELLTGSDGLASWILFTGVTAARWICGAIKGKDDSGNQKAKRGEINLQMLWDMGIAHERIPTMNVSLLRHLFYHLEERGAAFNPVIYSILDRNARRNQMSRQSN